MPVGYITLTRQSFGYAYYSTDIDPHYTAEKVSDSVGQSRHAITLSWHTSRCAMSGLVLSHYVSHSSFWNSTIRILTVFYEKATTGHITVGVARLTSAITILKHNESRAFAHKNIDVRSEAMR